MLIQERTYSPDTNSYRFGFQREEADSEIKGKGNSLLFKYRIHDPRLGRFLSRDPLFYIYSWNSTYAFAENQIISNIDLEGAEGYWFMHAMNGAYGETVQKISTGYNDGIDEVVSETWDFVKPNGGSAYKLSTWKNTGELLLGIGLSGTPGGGIPSMIMLDVQFGTDISGKMIALERSIQEIPNWDAYDWTKAGTKVIFGILTEKGIGQLTNITRLTFSSRSGRIGSKLSKADIFTDNIGTRRLAEDYALNTTKYSDYINMNEVRANNPVFDLINDAGDVVDVTTMAQTPKMNLSNLKRKVDNLSALGSDVNNRTLQIYVPEGVHTKDALDGMKKKLNDYMDANGIENVNIEIDIID